MFKWLGRLALVLVLTACGESQETSDLNAVVSKAVLFQKTIADLEAFTSMSKDSSGLIQGGRSMKFLIDQHGNSEPAIYFINGNYNGRCRTGINLDCALYHHDFARESIGLRLDVNTFNSQTYFTQSKQYVAGTLSSYTVNGKSFFAIQLYPQDVAAEQTIKEIAFTVKTAIKGVLGSSGRELAFVATGDQQTTTTIQSELAQEGIKSLTLNAILGDIKYIPLHQGEAWGYLRMFPQDQDKLLPTDIPVFDELPLDLSVVAATITHAFQDTNSHINLKSKERNTPNMVLRDAGPEQVLLKQFIDKPVHLIVTATSFTLEPTTDKIVQDKYKLKTSKPWTALKWTASSALASYDSMCAAIPATPNTAGKPSRPADCLKANLKFGSKGANLGFLKEIFKDRSVPQSAPLSYDPVPVGYAVPLKFYKDFIDLEANAEVKIRLNAFINKEKSGLISPADRNTEAAAIRQMILNAELPEANLKSVLDLARTLAPQVDKWKIRSSANAEDIEGFDGAGLHDSYAAKITSSDKEAKEHPGVHACTLVPDEEEIGGEVKMKVKPKTFACAVKGVYASLWNKRAIEERSFARIDHSSIAMGLAILPSYDTEAPVAANSVVVTRVINSKDILGYTLSIQKLNNTVTNPTPGTWSEQSIAALGSRSEPASLTTLRFAKPTKDTDVLTETILPKETTLQMAQIARKVEEAYCRAKGSYYSADPTKCSMVALDANKPKSLDMEMKFLNNGEFVLKQVREFGGQ